MKNTIAIIILVILLGGVSYFAYQQYKENSIRKEKDITKKEEIQIEATIIARKVDEEGLNHVTIEETENIIPSGEVESAVSPGILDTTAMALGIQKKQIKELTVINTTLSIENEKLRKIIEDGRTVYRFKDKYADLQVNVPIDTAIGATFDLTYNADLTIVPYWKKRWFLGAKRSYIDIYSNDKRTTVNGVNRLVIQQKEPHFGLRVQASGLINPQTGSYGVGPAARIDFNRLSLQYQHLYYSQSGRWRPNINLNYDIVRF